MRKDVELIEYPKRTELANFLTHAVGAAAAAAATAAALLKARGARAVISVAVYGFSLVAVYTASAVYHGLKKGRAKRTARIVDHCAVPLFIAGSATPCALTPLYRVSRPHCFLVLALAWFCAVFGIISKVFFFKRLKAATTAVYIVGCAVMLLSAIPILDEINLRAFGLILLSSALYLVGAGFCGLGVKRPYLHAVFHVFVLLGSAAHFYVVYRYIL